jgi:L-alanine-DL-glutamate epimerase-like enolase superfamily enzyme
MRLIGEDPTDVERVMLKIRQRGSFKPYGAAVSAIEHALWDIAGKAANMPAYKLLGGKVRDKVRSTTVRSAQTDGRPAGRLRSRCQVDDGADRRISSWSSRAFQFPFEHEGHYRGLSLWRHAEKSSGYHGAMDQGVISERGFNHMLDCVIAMKEVLGDKVSLALDCGPGWMLPDAIKFARAVEKYNLMWLEDMLTGDYVPWVNPQAYRELTTVDFDPHPYGEQIYCDTTSRS